jgi:hypothetical protein
MKRKPKKVLVDGEEEGVGMGGSSFRELSTAVQDRDIWQTRSGFDSKRSLTLFVVKELEDIFYPMLRDFQDVAPPVCPSGKSNV